MEVRAGFQLSSAGAGCIMWRCVGLEFRIRGSPIGCATKSLTILHKHPLLQLIPGSYINPHGTPRKLYATIHQCCILVIAAAMASLLPTTQRFLDLYPFFPCPLRSQHLYTQSTKIGVLRNDILNNYGYYNRKSFSTLPARPLHDSARIRPNPLYVFQLLKRSVSQNLPF